MGRSGLFDLEKHYAFYGAYHSNPINIFIHMLFVWPILFTILVLLYFTPSIFHYPQIGNLPWNIGFFSTVFYALFYISLDKKAGSLAALLCFLCWVGASSLASQLGYSLAWKVAWFFDVCVCCVFPISSYIIKAEGEYLTQPPFTNLLNSQAKWWFRFLGFSIFGLLDIYISDALPCAVVLAAQLFCWTAQFIGHGVFEKRAPALLDNLVQAFLMAPFFVLLEALQMYCGYEPYPGFHATVQARIDTEIKEWQNKKQKKVL